MHPPRRLRARQRLGKYRIEKRLARGGFADVYQAYDGIEGIRVALKIPQSELLNPGLLEDFHNEVRLTARLDHANILPIKNADFLEGYFVVASHLGQGSLADRMKRRISFPKALSFSEQILAALGHAHAHRVMHCDVKPDNFILFGDQLRLSDFGISKVAFHTMQASGSGTIGFMAPEQAMGRPSFRSDVFAAGLILYRLFAGVVPEWPFEWPPPGIERAERRLHPDLLAILERSLRIDPRDRYEDCQEMLEAVEAVRGKALRYGERRAGTKATKPREQADWRALQIRHFERQYRRELGTTSSCKKCSRPVSESMLACPWCGVARKTLREKTSFPAACTRCRRGLKLDWKYCPWCYGASVGPLSTRSYSDKRYSARCSGCRGDLMPFMRYCPWCRSKVRRSWTVPESRDRCESCGWGVLNEYWSTCPWCSKDLRRGVSRKRKKKR